MTEDNHDIEKYLKGELTPSQMHALEKKALDDPFLADALEGVQQLSTPDMTADLKLLNDALTKRTSKNTNVWVWPMRIAAGLIVVAVSSYLIISLNNQDGREKLALNRSETGPSTELEESTPVVADSVTTENNGQSNPALQPDREKSKDATIRPERKQPAASAPLPAEQSLALSDKPVEAGEEEKLEARKVEPEIAAGISVEETVASAPAEKPVAAKQQEFKLKKDSHEETDMVRLKSIAGSAAKTEASDDKIARRVVRGKVTFSEDGTGLPGVNIIVKGSNQGTVTDGQGNYILPLDDPNAGLTFSFIGFASKEIEANTNELNVQLDTDISELNEVVVVGYPSIDAGPLVPSPPPLMELAAPAGGRRVFKQYLEQNLQYPKQAIANQIEGKVIVQFSIGATGQLSDFRVIRGIGFGCDEEVIRLIKDGPQWAPTKKDDVAIRDKAKVRIKFSLNKKK